jgi:hypothetical protein
MTMRVMGDTKKRNPCKNESNRCNAVSRKEADSLIYLRLSVCFAAKQGNTGTSFDGRPTSKSVHSLLKLIAVAERERESDLL